MGAVSVLDVETERPVVAPGARTAPTVEDARSAAQAIAGRVPGVCRVLLYGSVARSEAVPGSDIDLVVVFGDIDYANRHHLATACRNAVADARHPIGLMVTDQSEWRIRSRLSTTIERRIADRHLSLVARPRLANGSNRQDKEMELPVSDIGEAYRRLGECAGACGKIVQTLHPSMAEKRMAAESGNTKLLEQRRARRYRNIVTECDMFLELSLKVIHHALSDKPPKYQHHLGTLLDDLPVTDASLRSRAILDRLRIVHLPANHRDDLDLSHEYTNWRSHGTYDLPSEAAKYLPESRVRDYLDAVTEMSQVVVDVLAAKSPGGLFTETPTSAEFLAMIQEVAEERVAHGLGDGEVAAARHRMAQRPPRENADKPRSAANAETAAGERTKHRAQNSRHSEAKPCAGPNPGADDAAGG